MNVRALVTEAFGFLHVGAIQLRVMLQLAWLLDAVVERLAVALVLIQAPRLEQAASLLRQRDDPVVAVESDGLHQP